MVSCVNQSQQPPAGDFLTDGLCVREPPTCSKNIQTKEPERVTFISWTTQLVIDLKILSCIKIKRE